MLIMVIFRNIKCALLHKCEMVGTTTAHSCFLRSIVPVVCRCWSSGLQCCYARALSSWLGFSSLIYKVHSRIFGVEKMANRQRKRAELA